MEFTLFPNLPTELRLHIWHLHFTSPRIHILHNAADASTDPECVLLTCTTIDPKTGTPLPPLVRTDITHEARTVAQRLPHPRERIRTLTDPVDYTTLSFTPGQWHGPPQQPTPAHGHKQQQPVDIAWPTDLIYLCTPRSAYAFMSLARRAWAGRVQRLAAAVPWWTDGPRPEDRHSGDTWLRGFPFSGFPFSCALLGPVVQALPAVREALVVLVPSVPGLVEGAVGVEPVQGGAGDVVADEGAGGICAAGLERGEDGFAGFAEYMRQSRAGGMSKASIHLAGVSGALEYRFERPGRGSGIAARKCAVLQVVDVDCCRLQDGEYRRRRRTAL